MSSNIEIFEDVRLPVIPLRGLVGFPAVQQNIEIVRPSSLKAFTAAATIYDAKILLVAQKDLAVEEPTAADLYHIGVLAEIKHVVKNPHGNLSVVFEGTARAKINSVTLDSGFMVAEATVRKESEAKASAQCEAMMLEVKSLLKNIKDIHPTFDEDMRIAAEAISSPTYFADFVASAAVIDYKNKQSVLEAFMLKNRLEKLGANFVFENVTPSNNG